MKMFTIYALTALLFIGLMTVAYAQEKRPVADIQADIEKLQAELREAVAAAEKMETQQPNVPIIPAQLAGPADPKILKIYTLPPNATEEEYEKQFTPFWKNFQLRRGDLPNLRFHLEKERLLLYGSAADHERMKDVVAGLQEIKVGEDTETFVTYEFPPPVTASFIAQVLPGVRIIPDESSPNRLIAHGRMFDHALVMTLYKNATQAKSEEATLFQQAEAAYQQEKFDEAKPLLEDFVAKYPQVDNLQFVLYYLGAIAMRNDNAQEAEFYFEQAIRMFPEGKKALACKTGLVWAKEKIGKQKQTAVSR